MPQLSYKNPISPIQSVGTPSLLNTTLFGTHFSTYGVGGYMEVYNLSDLYYTIPSNTYGLIQYSGNTIPISFSKGSGTTFSLNTLNLNSDLISSGRRKLGMIVYVYETDQTYQFLINNYDSLWSAATASTGTVVTNEFGTVVRADSNENISFINAWTGNTIEGVSGTSRQDAVWKKYYRTQQFINNLSTGLFYFTGITITSLTTFSVSPVKGWIVDNETDVMNPTITYVEYSGQTGLTTPYLSSSTITYISLTSGGTIVMSSTAPTTQQQRQNIYLGKLGHANRTSLIQAFNEPDYVQSPLSQMRDMFFPIGLINTGVYPSSNGANLQFNTSSGNLYGLGINYIGNIYTPNELIVSGQSPVTFQYRTQTGGTTGNITLIDPTNYDNGGVITLVGGGTNRSTNQRIFLTQTGTIRVQYGQQIYSDLPSAIAAANTENFLTFTNFRDNAILIGILSVRHTATNLSDTTQARFLLASKFGETIGSSGGISTTTLQQAYNNSSTPEIVTNSGLGALSIENGTGNPDSSTLLLEGQNSVGTTTSFLRADGLISGSTFSTQGFTANTNGITATTVSATTYYNLPSTSGITGSGTTNYISKWTGSTGLGDSQIVDDGSQVYIGGSLTHTGSKFGVSDPIEFQGIQMAQVGGSIGITDADLSSWGTSGQDVAIGTGGPLATNSGGGGNVAIGYQSMKSNSTGNSNVAVGFRSLYSNQSGQVNIALGYKAGQGIDSGSYNVLIGNEAGSNLTTEDNRLYIANNTYGTLIYGEFDNGIVNIGGTLSATTYDNLPGSSSANCFSTFFVTNITGCSPVNMLSPLNVQDGISVTGTSNFTSQVNFTGGISASTFSATSYQNLPSFNSVQINGVTQFSGDTNNFINFSGINVTITSAATNTLVFSAGTGGGVSGNFLPTSGGTITGNLTVTGNTNVSGTTTSTGNVTSLQNLQSLYSVGDEGGEILLSKPQTNTSISGTGVTIDIFQNRLRFFEQGGSNRGAFIDLTSATNGVGSNLLNAGATDYYTITVNQGGFSPADATTYYIGQGGYAPSTTVNTRNVSIPFTSTLTNVTIVSGAGNVASTENTTVIFRLNNTTDTTLSSTVKFSGGNAQSNGATLTYNISGLTISVNANDFFEIKFTTPTWVTNPTSASLTMMLFFRR